MVDPWEVAPAPDTHGRSLFSTPISLSGLTVAESEYLYFSYAEFMASLHGSNWRYVDCHKANIACDDDGRFVVFDYPSVVAGKLDPTEMANDFLTPSVDFSPQEFRAFVCGYVEAANSVIEPRFPGYTTALLRALNCEVLYDPRNTPSDYLQARAILQRVLADSSLNEQDFDQTEVLRLAIASMLLSSVAGKARPISIVKLLFPKDASSEGSISPRAYLSSNPALASLKSLVVELFPDDTASTTKAQSSAVASKKAWWPSARFGAEIDALLENRSDLSLFRASLVCANLALAHLSSCDDENSIRTALNAATLGLVLCAEPGGSAEQFERRHFFFWNTHYSNPIGEIITPGSARVFGYAECLAQSLFLCQAAKFEIEFWSASYRDKKSGKGEICWHALPLAFQCIRGAITLAEHFLLATHDGQAITPYFLSLASQLVATYQQANFIAGASAREGFKVHLRPIYGSNPEQLFAERDWIDAASNALSSNDASIERLRQLFHAGHTIYRKDKFTIHAWDADNGRKV